MAYLRDAFKPINYFFAPTAGLSHRFYNTAEGFAGDVVVNDVGDGLYSTSVGVTPSASDGMHRWRLI